MIDFERGTTNVYADLGFDDPEEQLVKAKLVRTIQLMMRARNLKQIEAAPIMSVQQGALSKLLKGNFDGFSEKRLMKMLTLLGADINIVINKNVNTSHIGTINVIHG
ncbi:MAG: helix-turn-helix domain-containing protein [Enterobacteriaceae bacterium]|jgi:predicted XRE-type DNA-binding protein|nr:helix-turn-helix domain-containing protein [Enterobacteriaceae bacterium]